ncbi:MAG TPA: hypothetical protein VME20_12625 [Acidimicrobiales bacterium]|nr:hypothetical protein [Acidimicrobiales bacterium]
MTWVPHGGLGPARELLAGEVSSFDRDAGLGEVQVPGGLTYPFHCTEIAGGSRDIALGTPVRFFVAAAHRGRLEARALLPFA